MSRHACRKKLVYICEKCSDLTAAVYWFRKTFRSDIDRVWKIVSPGYVQFNMLNGDIIYMMRDKDYTKFSVTVPTTEPLGEEYGGITWNQKTMN